ncbi:MAG: phosphotransferase enzyme family protein [Acidimicrobiales bacterium]
MPTPDQFIAAAWEAAPAFGLTPETVEILSVSENVVCKVTQPGGARVVMRLHRPGYNTLDELNNEVHWVRALGAAGIPVPTAVPTLDGAFYTAVATGGEDRHVGVVEWVEGQPVRSSPRAAVELAVVDDYRRIGALAAQIRAQSWAWTPPPGFTRRRWDADGLAGEQPLWGRFWEVDALTATQQTVVADARHELLDELRSLSTEDDRFGLIHADLHLGNLMADGEHLTIIDFDDAGHGWFAYEVAVALHEVSDEPWFDDCRTAMIDGYRAIHPLDAVDEALIETFLVVRSFMVLAWLDARPEVSNHEQLDDLAADAVAAAERYLSR